LPRHQQDALLRAHAGQGDTVGRDLVQHVMVQGEQVVVVEAGLDDPPALDFARLHGDRRR